MPAFERRRRIGLVASGRTDVGLVRTHNEDAYLVAALGDGATVTKGTASVLTVQRGPTVLVVADGVGGAASGEIASLMATDTILIELRRRHERGMLKSGDSMDAAVDAALAAANHVIHTYASGNPQHRGMATTATVALVYDTTLLLAQIGDSRAYLVRDGTARQLTKDQSLVQRLIDAGELTEAEAANSDRRNIILQALGSEPVVVPDMYREMPEPGDVLILCSDGLSNHVSPHDMARIALAEPDTGMVCERLVECANTRGGHDNITVVVARFTAIEIEAGPEPMPESASPKLADRVRRWLR